MSEPASTRSTRTRSKSKDRPMDQSGTTTTRLNQPVPTARTNQPDASTAKTEPPVASTQTDRSGTLRTRRNNKPGTAHVGLAGLSTQMDQSGTVTQKVNQLGPATRSNQPAKMDQPGPAHLKNPQGPSSSQIDRTLRARRNKPETSTPPMDPSSQSQTDPSVTSSPQADPPGSSTQIEQSGTSKMDQPCPLPQKDPVGPSTLMDRTLRTRRHNKPETSMSEPMDQSGTSVQIDQPSSSPQMGSPAPSTQIEKPTIPSQKDPPVASPQFDQPVSSKVALRTRRHNKPGTDSSEPMNQSGTSAQIDQPNPSPQIYLSATSSPQIDPPVPPPQIDQPVSSKVTLRTRSHNKPETSMPEPMDQSGTSAKIGQSGPSPQIGPPVTSSPQANHSVPSTRANQPSLPKLILRAKRNKPGTYTAIMEPPGASTQSNQPGPSPQVVPKVPSTQIKKPTKPPKMKQPVLSKVGARVRHPLEISTGPIDPSDPSQLESLATSSPRVYPDSSAPAPSTQIVNQPVSSRATLKARRRRKPATSTVQTYQPFTLGQLTRQFTKSSQKVPSVASTQIVYPNGSSKSRMVPQLSTRARRDKPSTSNTQMNLPGPSTQSSKPGSSKVNPGSPIPFPRFRETETYKWMREQGYLIQMEQLHLSKAPMIRPGTSKMDQPRSSKSPMIIPGSSKMDPTRPSKSPMIIPGSSKMDPTRPSKSPMIIPGSSKMDPTRPSKSPMIIPGTSRMDPTRPSKSPMYKPGTSRMDQPGPSTSFMSKPGTSTQNDQPAISWADYEFDSSESDSDESDYDQKLYLNLQDAYFDSVIGKQRGMNPDLKPYELVESLPEIEPFKRPDTDSESDEDSDEDVVLSTDPDSDPDELTEQMEYIDLEAQPEDETTETARKVLSFIFYKSTDDKRWDGDGTELRDYWHDYCGTAAVPKDEYPMVAQVDLFEQLLVSFGDYDQELQDEVMAFQKYPEQFDKHLNPLGLLEPREDIRQMTSISVNVPANPLEPNIRKRMIDKAKAPALPRHDSTTKKRLGRPLYRVLRTSFSFKISRKYLHTLTREQLQQKWDSGARREALLCNLLTNRLEIIKLNIVPQGKFTIQRKNKAKFKKARETKMLERFGLTSKPVDSTVWRPNCILSGRLFQSARVMANRITERDPPPEQPKFKPDHTYFDEHLPEEEENSKDGKSEDGKSKDGKSKDGKPKKEEPIVEEPEPLKYEISATTEMMGAPKQVTNREAEEEVVDDYRIEEMRDLFAQPMRLLCTEALHECNPFYEETNKSSTEIIEEMMWDQATMNIAVDINNLVNKEQMAEFQRQAKVLHTFNKYAVDPTEFMAIPTKELIRGFVQLSKDDLTPFESEMRDNILEFVKTHIAELPLRKKKPKVNQTGGDPQKTLSLLSTRTKRTHLQANFPNNTQQAPEDSNSGSTSVAEVSPKAEKRLTRCIASNGRVFHLPTDLALNFHTFVRGEAPDLSEMDSEKELIEKYYEVVNMENYLDDLEIEERIREFATENLV